MAASPAPASPGGNLNNNNNNQQPPPEQQQQQQQPPPPPGVRKCGYLRKQKHGHKRFFVLRGPGGGGGGAAAGEEEEAASPQQQPQQPARLEYYESEKKWRSKSAAPKRSIALDAAAGLSVHKRADAKHRHLLALYTRGESFALAAESEPEQEAWFQAISELLQESQAAAGGSPRHASPGEDFFGPGAPAAAAASYREVWEVTLKPKGLGQSRHLTGLHRLCLSARTVGLVRPGGGRPCVTLQLMTIRRCGHSDSFFFMELGRSASTGPGELWMQADDAVVAQHIHEAILEAMKALRELAEFRPRSKSQSSSAAASASAASAGGNAGVVVVGGGPGLASMCSRPISVPGRRHPGPHLPAPPSQAGRLLRRSRTDILAVAGSSSGSSSGSSQGSSSRGRTGSESDGLRADSLSGSPLSPETGQPLPHGLGLRGAPSPLRAHPGGSLALGPPSSLGPKLTPEASHRLSGSSASASGSPSDLAGFLAFEDLGSSPAGEILPFSSSSATSSATSHPSDTPETPPGWRLDGYVAMERDPLRYQPCLCGEDKGPRKRTYSLTTPAHQGSLPPPASSASLDEYTLMQATFSRAGYSPKTTYTPYPEDYCDVDIGCGSGISGDRSHLGCSVPKEDGYMPMSPGVSSVASLQTDSDGYMSMHPTGVSAPQQIAPSYSYKTNRESSPDDCGYMHMWGTRTRLPGESPEERLASDDYISMSSLLLPPTHGPSASDSPTLPTDHFSALRLGNQAGPLGSLLHACQQQPGSHGEERKDSDQYVLMSSPTGRQNYTPKGKLFLAPCNNTAVHLSMQRNHTETSFSQKTGNARPSHPSLGLLLPIMNEQPLLKEPQSSSGDYVDIGYSLGPTCEGLSSLLNRGLGGHKGSRISSYMNLNFDGPQAKAVSLGPLEEILVPGSCPKPGKLNKHYLKVGMQMACLPSPTSEAGDYAEMIFNTATVPPQPISRKPESVCVTGPGLKQLTLPQVEAFVFASPPFDPNRGAKVIRADPQGRRRHSSETFLSTTTVTPVSPSFAHHPKRQNSASVENVSLRKNEGLRGGEQNSSPMCRETSAGFQNGLNYIAVDALDGRDLAIGDQVDRYPFNGNIHSTYASINVLAHNLKKASLVKE